MPSVILSFDGSCLSNPGGPGGWGWRLTCSNGNLIASDNGRLAAAPTLTNNVAEWEGLLRGLEYLADKSGSFEDVRVRGDSKLILGQASGTWRVKAAHLKPFATRCKELLRTIGAHRVQFAWVPREENKACDLLSKGKGALSSQESRAMRVAENSVESRMLPGGHEPAEKAPESAASVRADVADIMAGALTRVRRRLGDRVQIETKSGHWDKVAANGTHSEEEAWLEVSLKWGPTAPLTMPS